MADARALRLCRNVAHRRWAVGAAALARCLLPAAAALDADYITTVVAILGTTISPYLFFWQASQEVEDIERTRAGSG